MSLQLPNMFVRGKNPRDEVMTYNINLYKVCVRMVSSGLLCADIASITYLVDRTSLGRGLVSIPREVRRVLRPRLFKLLGIAQGRSDRFELRSRIPFYYGNRR